MRAELKSIHSPDVDPGTYWPEDPGTFRFLLQAMIGPEGEAASESFNFEVCSPKWLMANGKAGDIRFGRHMLLVTEYDLAAIESRLRSLCARTIGSSWDEVATKLGAFGRWEFENYQE